MIFLNKLLMIPFTVSFIIIQSRNCCGESRSIFGKLASKSKTKTYDPGVAIVMECYRNVQYFAKISLGTPKEGEEQQWFYVNMDTGSSDLWVPAADSCSASPENCANNKGFDPSKSSTFHGSRETFLKTYADGTHVEGTLALDTFAIGTIKIPKLRFGLSKLVKGAHTKADGVLGLGFGASSGFPGNSKSVFEQLTEQANILPQFGIALHDRDSEGKRIGHLFIGGFDRRLVDGKFTVVKVQKEYFATKYWAFSLDSLSAGDKRIYMAEGIKTIVDTGASIISMPQRLLDDILAEMPQQERVIFQTKKVFRCNDVKLDSLPNISFIINKKSFVLTPNDYIEELFSSSNGAKCILSLAPHEMFFILLGDTFMRKYYVRFDMGKKEIGFAKIKLGSTGTVQESNAQPGNQVDNNPLTNSDGEDTSPTDATEDKQVEGNNPTEAMDKTGKKSEGDIPNESTVSKESVVKDNSATEKADQQAPVGTVYNNDRPFEDNIPIEPKNSNNGQYEYLRQTQGIQNTNGNPEAGNSFVTSNPPEYLTHTESVNNNDRHYEYGTPTYEYKTPTYEYGTPNFNTYGNTQSQTPVTPKNINAFLGNPNVGGAFDNYRPVTSNFPLYNQDYAYITGNPANTNQGSFLQTMFKSPLSVNNQDHF